MSILDDIRAKAGALLESQGPKVTDGLEKVRGFAEEKTGGKLGEQVQSGIQKAKDALSGLAGKG